jgi:hypothetical protein
MTPSGGVGAPGEGKKQVNNSETVFKDYSELTEEEISKMGQKELRNRLTYLDTLKGYATVEASEIYEELIWILQRLK